jgi:hypothetical protein
LPGRHQRADLVLGNAARIIATGAAIGLLLAAALGQTISAFLFGVQPLDACLHGHITVQYGRHPKFDVFVPLEMRETYTSLAGEEVTTIATYSDFRRFEPAGRLILPQ